MSKKHEAPPAPEKSGAEQVLEEIRPQFATITKELAELKRHLHPQAPKEKSKPDAPVISSGEGTGIGEDQQHAAVKLNNPRWNYCPWCDDDTKAKLPELPADAPAELRTQPVKCSNCGERGVQGYKRCPGCGAKSDFDPD